MGLDTKIEWCDDTLNLWWGCNKVASTCENCYAAELANRYHHETKLWGSKPDGAVRLEVKSWKKNLAKMGRVASAANQCRTVFVGSMMDWADRHDMPCTNGRTIGEIRDEFLDMVADYPQLTFLMLTSRPGQVHKALGGRVLPPNVWLGVSIGNQEEMDVMAPKLLTQAQWIDGQPRYFLSIEPMLGPIDVQPALATGKVGWVIVGGESGHNARPMDVLWADDVRRACSAAAVPFFFKQWGMYGEDGKKAASKHDTGRHLFGRTYSDVPEEFNQPVL